MSGYASGSLSASAIGTFTLENAGTGPLAGGVTTLGQTFAQGELPAGAGLSARRGATAVDVQFDVKTTWPDGSAKMAVLSIERPALAAGASVEMVLERVAAPPPAAPDIDLMTALDGRSFTVDLAIQGRASIQLDVLDALRDAIEGGTASFWQRGELATQARVSVLVPDSSMRLVFDVTAFKGGGFEVEAVFANDRAMEAVGGRVDYGVTVRMNGQTVLQDTLSQAQYQNWHETFSSNGRDGSQGLGDPSAGWLNIRQDVAKLARLGVVADYDAGLPIPESMLAGYMTAVSASGWGDPFAPNGVTTYMPMAGGRADLGIVTQANSAWLISQDARAAAYAMGQAEAASGVTWQFWDQANGTWLNTENYPYIWVDARGGTGRPGDPTSTGLVQQREPMATSGWHPEEAHQPELSFVPYVMTGERWILDNLNAQAAWNLTQAWPYPRQNGLGLLADSMNIVEVRAVAWGLREIENALWATPDGSTERSFLESVSDANWSWLVSKIPEWTALQGETHGYLPIEPQHAAVSPWQQDYFASTIISAASRGNADALTYLNWAKNFLIGRFFAGDEGFSPRDGVATYIRTGDPTTREVYKTWEEVGAATAAAGLSHGWTAWTKATGEYGRLALSTLAGIYHLTGDLEAFNAYRLLMRLDYPWTTDADFAANPQYAVTIPGTDPDGNETITLTHLVNGGTIDLGAGADLLVLASGGANRIVLRNVETVQGGNGDDHQIFGTGDQAAYGGDGNDSLNMGAGADTAIGGAGDDVYWVDSTLDRVTELADKGVDRVISTISLNLMAGVENLTLVGAAARNANGNSLDNGMIGNALDNRLNGGAGDDNLWGMGGADTLIGSTGNDRFTGGEGADSMFGGAGDDTYQVDDAGDRVIEAAGDGVDLVLSTIDYTLGAHVENLTLMGSARQGTGNSADNLVTGTDLANALAGLAGNDRLQGRGGHDTVDGGDGADVLFGGLGNDVLAGGAGDDVLVGCAEADRLTGGTGSDAFRFQDPTEGGDTIVDFTAGIDRIEVSRAGFGGALAVGPLAAAAFSGGGVAVGSAPQLVYSAATGVLRWDADGAGGGAAVTLAVLENAPLLTFSDIVVIG